MDCLGMTCLPVDHFSRPNACCAAVTSASLAPLRPLSSKMRSVDPFRTCSSLWAALYQQARSPRPAACSFCLHKPRYTSRLWLAADEKRQRLTLSSFIEEPAA